MNDQNEVAKRASVVPADGRTRISATVDFDAVGVQHGHLVVPNSTNESPWGSLMMPISVFRNGEGPTVLLVGGNHGDEYEGPIALMHLIRSLDVDELSGTVIALPALNYPAVKSGTRVSPLDGRNMNRIFPGRPDGTVTEAIADYVQRFLLPRADAVVDIHSGGRAMRFLPMTVVHHLPDRQQMDACMAASRAFGAPYCLVLEELDAEGMLDTSVESMGKIFVSTELGGGASTTVETVRIARHGVFNVLRHLDMIPGELTNPPDSVRMLETPSEGSYVIAPCDGIYEVAAEPGDSVAQEEVLGRIHDIDEPTVAAVEARARTDGLLVHRHVAGTIRKGDCLGVVAIDYAGR